MKMAAASKTRPDKAKVVDEVWDDERIGEFLEKGRLGDEPDDFSKLLYAYRSMRVEDFKRFVDRFAELGGDVHAPARDGRSVAEVIAKHKRGAPFLKILNAV